MMMMLAQAIPVEAQTIVPIASTLAAAGPYALAAILLMIVWFLWKEQKENRAEMKSINAEFLNVIREQTKAITESATSMREMRESIIKMEGAVSECPKEKR